MLIQLWTVVLTSIVVQITKTLWPSLWEISGRWQWTTAIFSATFMAFSSTLLETGVWEEALLSGGYGAIAGFTAIGMFRAIKESAKKSK